MPVTGIAIFKLLPKTNCGDCGVPTCLAFAMQLASGKAELSACPHVSQEAIAQLEEASAPPIRPVTIGTGETELKIGGETVMFRHEKRFENPPGLALLITDDTAEPDIENKVKKFNDFQYERVGLTLRPELIAIKDTSGDAQIFASVVNKVKQATDCGLILMSNDLDIMAAGLKACVVRKPLLFAATSDNLEAMAKLAKENSCPLTVKGSGMDELSELTDRLASAGINDVVLDSGARTLKKTFEDQIAIRSLALNKKHRPLGFPTIIFPCEMTDNPMQESVIASIFIAKYGGIIVLSDFEGHSLFPLLVERLNIYTDPQRPLATTQGIYEIGGPDENSPVLITSNFSLTYFIVSGEIETSRVPSYLLVQDTEGLSVMTAWAAGKFVADVIAPFVNKSGISDKISHRNLIIPGYAAAESGSLEEELPDWTIQVGPREGAHIPAYLKEWTP
ncbi:acetyl-CoA decarbonylase/synthase complex subunit gamma [Chloroflexota bacterium]